MDKLPTVSVYIPTRNRQVQLANCLRAILSQEGAALEVIVIDDGSDDGTPRLLRRLQRRGLLRCVLLRRQSGAQTARNIGVSMATGDFITGADDDDIWLPGRIATMLQALKEGAPFVAASDIMDLGDGRRYLQCRPDEITLDAILRRNVVGNQVMTPTTLFRACGTFDASLPASQDYDFWIRLVTKVGSGRGIGRPLQWVDASLQRKRISTSINRRRGVWQVYRKHRHLMSRAQRKAHLFNVLRTINRPISWRTAATLATKDDRVRILLHYIRSRVPIVDDVVLSILCMRHRRTIRAALGTCQSAKLRLTR
jgi:glycosyltransferase involved in cell wall biosynthesis